MNDAQLRAMRKYEKKNIKQVLLKLNRRTEPELVAKIESVENKAGYLKELIRRDLECGGNTFKMA